MAEAKEHTSHVPNAPRLSAKFNASDADVEFFSSDNVLFHIHRKNLEANTGAFPSAKLLPLAEDAATLELLFQFIYPQRHPYLENTPFKELSPLAEAVEKYKVFPAMHICRIRMKQKLLTKTCFVPHELRRTT
ncbi:hypothetical protein H0H81_004229 [Sphagnurus paluster]|uniref:BTB domain-containing protein n=1 Tax=Sphagnurus paluster TaxID=117069 RepID=A0A9P7FWE8_9AGAR|nr:hypothetical protein H0H81_004229 [Sphagnurus paluster]